jgi:SAM-dependent methyltransferase
VLLATSLQVEPPAGRVPSCSLTEAMSLKEWVRDRLSLPDAAAHTARLIHDGGCRTCLDIGCGTTSVLSRFRPAILSVGLDAFPGAVEAARAKSLHDRYIVADILQTTPESILRQSGMDRFDLVALYDVIEHLPKRRGYEVLEVCEALTRRFVLVQTPNGYQEQGPEFGNPYQRHLSGWFGHDFEGLGYQVFGVSGTRYFHGYAGEFKTRLPGRRLWDVLLARLLQTDRHYRHAFNLLAIRDVRGVAARLGSESGTPAKP